MKFMLPAKYLSITVLAVTVAVGCATQAPPKEKPVAQKPSGPSAALTQALDSARAAIKQAKSLHWIWRDTGKIMKKAEAAAKKGDEATAIKLANKARTQAELAVNQYYLEHAKALLRKMSGYSMNADQKQRLNAAADAIRNHEGRKAYDILNQLMAEVKTNNIQYQVVRGDSLWGIAARPNIYDNPYEWPLIYKANSDKIKDADLIYPGQVFSIDMNPSAADVDAAVHHAKTRGAWSLGTVEQSDRDYLGGSLRVR